MRSFFDFQVQRAAYTAEGAGRTDRSKLPDRGSVLEYPAVKAAHGADLDTLSAELTVQLLAETGFNDRVETSLREVDLSFALHLVADPDALPALDAPGLVALDEGRLVVDLLFHLDGSEPARILPVLEGHVLQVATPRTEDRRGSRGG